MISKTYNLITTAIPKTGTKSIKQSLDMEYIHLSTIVKHITLEQILKNKLLNNNFLFTFVRHPYDRFLSCYHFSIQQKDKINKYKFKSIWDMIKFMENDENTLRIWSPMTKWINPKYLYLYNYIGHYENFNSNFEKLKKINNISDKQLPFVNISEKRQKETRKYPYIKNKTIRGFCYEYYRRDFEVFGYKK